MGEKLTGIENANWHPLDEDKAMKEASALKVLAGVTPETGKVHRERKGDFEESVEITPRPVTAQELQGAFDRLVKTQALAEREQNPGLVEKVFRLIEQLRITIGSNLPNLPHHSNSGSADLYDKYYAQRREQLERIMTKSTKELERIMSHGEEFASRENLARGKGHGIDKAA